MFETAFATLFRAVDRIRRQLEQADDDLKKYLAEELVCLQRLGEQCIDRWLALDEQIQELFDLHNLYLPPEPAAVYAPVAVQAQDASTATTRHKASQPDSWPPLDTSMHWDAVAFDWSDPIAVSLRKGMGYYDLRMYSESVQFLSQAAEQSDDPLVRIYLASAYAALQQWDQALAQLQTVRAAAGDPLVLAACAEVQADIHASRGEYRQAARCYRDITERMPEFSDGWYNLGVCLAKVGAWEDAAQALMHAIHRNPNDAEALYLAAAIDVRRGAFDRADTLCHRALRLRPQHAGSLLTRARILCATGQPDRAAAVIRQVLRMQPSHEAAWSQLAWCCVLQEDLEQAIAVLKKFLSIHPGHAFATVQLGILYMLAEQYDAAERVLRCAAGQFPDTSYLAVALGRIAAARGDVKEAFQHFIRALRDPRRAVKRLALYFLGRALYQDGQFAQAEKYFRASAVLGPRNPAILIALGRTAERLGRPHEAEKYYTLATQPMERSPQSF